MIKTTDKKINLWIYIFLSVLTFVVYMGVLHNDFTNYDDDAYVTENLQTQAGITFNGIKWAFTTNHTGYWHPLTWMSLMLDSQLFGVKPWGYHLTGLIIHIANVLLLFVVLKAMTGAVWRSAFVAVIFAIHPLNVESVAWVAERKNVLSTMFWLFTMGSYWEYSRTRNAKWYLLTLLLFAMGLMSKPMVVTLPFTLLLLDYWPLERLKSLRDWKAIWKLVIEKVPFFVLSVVSGIITIWGQKIEGVMVNIESVSLVIRFENAVLSYGKYIAKSFWPTKLGVLYTVSDILIWQVIVSIAVLSVISIFVIKYARRRKYLLVGWVWYLGTLVPVIGLIQVGSQAMADRYAYVPMIGLLVMVGWGAWDLTEQWVNRNAILRFLAGCVIVALSILTYIQIGYWKSSITLFEHTLRAASDNSIVRCNLGAAYVETGDYEKAKNSLERAISISPDAKSYLNLGVAYSRLGNHKKAVEALEKSAEIDPNDSKTYTNLCLAYSETGQYEKAVNAGMKAIKLAPAWSAAYYNLSIAYSKMNNYTQAIEVLKKAVALNPNNVDAYCNMGVGYLNMEQYKQAIEAFKETIRIKPASVEGHFNLGLAYISVGNKQAATMEYEILRTINPQTAERLMAEINKGIRQTVPTK